MHRLLLPLAVLIALLVTTPASAKHLTTADPTPDKRIGFNDVWGTMHPDANGYRTQAQHIPGYVFDDIAAMGRILPDQLTSNRLHVNWEAVEPHNNVTEGGCAYYGGDWLSGHCYFWQQADAVFNALVAQGDRPILHVSAAPQWARPGMGCAIGSGCFAYPPDSQHHADWLYFVYRAIQRYGGQSIALEVWNEPNLGKYWAPGPNASSYAELVRIAYEARYYTGSSIPIVTGGLAPTQQHESNWPERVFDRVFLRDIYAYSPYMKEWFDGIGYHPYAGENASVDGMWAHLDRIFGERDAQGDGGTPVWITEMSVSSAIEGGDVAQGDRLVQLYKSIQGHPIRSFLIHHFRDQASGDESWKNRTAGVRNWDGSYKYGSYCRLGQYFGGHFGFASPC